MMQLKEIADTLKGKIEEAGFTGSDAMEKFMKSQSENKAVDGFVDPFSYSPIKREVYEAIRKVSLQEIVGGGTGSDWISYLVPTKIYQTLLDGFAEEDISTQILAYDVPSFEGGSLDIDWGLADSMTPVDYTEPGGPPMVQLVVNKANLKPIPFGMDMGISQTLVEDSAFGLVEAYVRNAGKAMGAYATKKVLQAMFAGYDSSNNAVAGASDAITVAQVISAVNAVEAQGGLADTAVITAGQKSDLMADTTTYNLALAWKERQTESFTLQGTFGLNWFTRRTLTNSGLYSTADTDYYALVFEKARGAARAWKRPLTIKNYDNPRDGLVGAFVTARQASAAIHDGDFISAILET